MLFSHAKPSSSQLEEEIAKTLLTDREKELLRLLVGAYDSAPERAEETVRYLTQGMDIDNESSYYLLQLAGYGRQTGWEHFPEQIIPRLKGLHRYHQAHNAMGLPWLIGKLELLRAAGVPVMVIKGLAMRIVYAPDTPRIMWDYDIAVPEDRFEETMAILRGGDTEFKSETAHSEALTGIVKGNNVELDIHRFIFKSHGEKGTDIWKRALPFEFHGLDLLTLCQEDMLIHQLDTHAGNYMRNELSENRMKWFIDVRKIAEAQPIDAASLYARAQEFGVEYAVRLMLDLYKRCLPEDGLIGAIDYPEPEPAGYAEWISHSLVMKKEMAEFMDLNLSSGYRFTPRLLRASIRRSYYEWWLFRAGERVAKERSTYIRFLGWKKLIQSPADLYNRYITRLFKANPRKTASLKVDS